MLCIIHIRGWLQSGSNQQVSDLGGYSYTCVFLCLCICVFVDTSTCSQVCDCSSGKDCVCIHSVRASIPRYVVRASIPPLSPAGRAPGPPFTPTWVKETFPHRYLGGDLALFLRRVRILPISEIKDGSSQESVLLKKAPCIIYQIFRIRVPNRSGSAWPSKGILDVHNLGSEDDVQLWNPCCSLRASWVLDEFQTYGRQQSPPRTTCKQNS